MKNKIITLINQVFKELGQWMLAHALLSSAFWVLAMIVMVLLEQYSWVSFLIAVGVVVLPQLLVLSRIGRRSNNRSTLTSFYNTWMLKFSLTILFSMVAVRELVLQQWMQPMLFIAGVAIGLLINLFIVFFKATKN